MGDKGTNPLNWVIWVPVIYYFFLKTKCLACAPSLRSVPRLRRLLIICLLFLLWGFLPCTCLWFCFLRPPNIHTHIKCSTLARRRAPTNTEFGFAGWLSIREEVVSPVQCDEKHTQTRTNTHTHTHTHTHAAQ